MEHFSDCSTNNAPAYKPGKCDCGISDWAQETTKLIQGAIEKVESSLGNLPPTTRRHAELQLVWHHLMDAYVLLTSGRLTPDSLIWASSEAEKITEGST